MLLITGSGLKDIAAQEEHHALSRKDIIVPTTRRCATRRPQAVIFNQLDQLPNSLWHYSVTGPAMKEVFRKIGTETPGQSSKPHSSKVLRSAVTRSSITVAEASGTLCTSTEHRADYQRLV